MRPKVTLMGLMKTVCREYSIKEAELRGSGRGRRLSEVRGMAAWLILELGVSTLGELGKVTGRDVTTLSSAAKRLQIRAKEDLELAGRMRNLLKATLLNCNIARPPILLRSSFPCNVLMTLPLASSWARSPKAHGNANANET